MTGNIRPQNIFKVKVPDKTVVSVRLNSASNTSYAMRMKMYLTTELDEDSKEVPNINPLALDGNNLVNLNASNLGVGDTIRLFTVDYATDTVNVTDFGTPDGRIIFQMELNTVLISPAPSASVNADFDLVFSQNALVCKVKGVYGKPWVDVYQSTTEERRASTVPCTQSFLP